jgi:uncharacterized protein YjbJ (UPF0337 family)
MVKNIFAFVIVLQPALVIRLNGLPIGWTSGYFISLAAHITHEELIMITEEKTESAISQVGKIVDKQIDQANADFQNTATKITDVVGSAKDRIVSGAKTAVETFETFTDKANKLQASSTESLRSSTRSSPLVALALAITAGYLWGRVSKFRRDDTSKK